MSNIVLMLHNNFGANTLKLAFSKLPDVNVIVIPVETSKLPFSDQTRILHETLNARDVNPKDIDFLFIESNYGKPADIGVNACLFEYCLSGFERTKIISYGSTPDSIRSALHYNERIMFWGNGIQHQVNQEGSENYSSRIYDVRKMKFELCSVRQRSHSAPVTPAYSAQSAHFSVSGQSLRSDQDACGSDDVNRERANGAYSPQRVRNS